MASVSGSRTPSAVLVPTVSLGMAVICDPSLTCISSVVVGHTTGKLEGAGFNIWSCLCAPIGAYRNRRTIQTKYSIKESEDGSMCAVGCCLCCAYSHAFMDHWFY